MNQNLNSIVFNDIDRSYWIKAIMQVYGRYSSKNKSGLSGKEVVFVFDKCISPAGFKPFHLVTLACLIQFLKDLGITASISKSNADVFQYIYYDLGFSEYWRGKKDHVNAPLHNRVFNLWRITEGGKDLYAKQVEEYLRRTYFANKDLSAVSVGLVEAYYNVFDHANAKGNAFSLIQYEEESNLLYVAVSDFGIGIAKSVSDYDKKVTSDKEAILKALEDNFTVKSTERNRGMGLSIIIAPAKEARIISHKGLVYKHDNVVEGYESDLFFPGTLVYYEIDLSQMEDEEIMNEFVFFN